MDLSMTRDADLWAEMSKVTFEVQARVDNMICCTSAEVELTDTACQVDLIPGLSGVGFSREEQPIRFSKEAAERSLASLETTPPAAEPVASSSVSAFRGDDAISPSTGETVNAGKCDYRIKDRLGPRLGSIPDSGIGPRREPRLPAMR